MFCSLSWACLSNVHLLLGRVMLAFFTREQPRLSVCVMIAQSSNNSLWMESKVMSSGSFAIAGVGSVNS